MHRTRTILVLFTACLTCAPAALATPELSPLPVGPAIPLPAPSPPPVVAAEQPGEVATPHPQDGLPQITFAMPLTITPPPVPPVTKASKAPRKKATKATRKKATKATRKRPAATTATRKARTRPGTVAPRAGEARERHA